ncbi:MAG: ATP-binding cassette domain-containing protein, partial [Candidatus Omnitrophica bacterium]|nr:ATP-binding cassette domain-containing protein [Candidatus Omnitrophota bacterium]
MELLKVRNLKKIFSKHKVIALDGVDISILKGEICGLVGESGCGKSTFARAILRLIDVQ